MVWGTIKWVLSLAAQDFNLSSCWHSFFPKPLEWNPLKWNFHVWIIYSIRSHINYP